MKFFQQEVRYIISQECIKADDYGARTNENFPVPQNIHDVQNFFLEMCSYFLRFIQNFSTIAKPLLELTKKDKNFEFEQRN